MAALDQSQTDGHPTRRYRSPLRARRASETRLRIATAAGELFGEHGFAGTTVAAIAENAGVSAQTVYATFGSKGAIVRALLTQFESDADAAGWWARIDAEADPRRKLTAFAGWSSALFSSSKAVIATAKGAVGDPALVELRDQGDQHRRTALQGLVSGLGAAGDLRPDLNLTHGVDRAWLLSTVDLYLAATDGCGWSDSEYADWLALVLQEQLLGPAAAAR